MSSCKFNYAVIAAFGRHGDAYRVRSVHKTAQAARTAAARRNRRSKAFRFDPVRIGKVVAIAQSCVKKGQKLPRSKVVLLPSRRDV